MANPLISTVIPTYNYAHYVTEAVDSALAQTFSDHEVIVVDDGSRDDTRERLAPYGDRIRYIFQENQGVSAARNTGVRAARGKWIAFLDSDDLWHPRKLEIQVVILQKYPDSALFATRSMATATADWRSIEIEPSPSVVPITLAQLVFRTRFGPSSVLVAKKAVIDSGLFYTNLTHAEDRDMWIRICRGGPIVLIDCPLWWYRVHGASASANVDVMEVSESVVLRKAFAEDRFSIPSLLLHRKAMSYAQYSAAVTRDEMGQHGKALARMLRSWMFWPLPYRGSDVVVPLGRAKKLAVILSRIARKSVAGAAVD